MRLNRTSANRATTWPSTGVLRIARSINRLPAGVDATRSTVDEPGEYRCAMKMPYCVSQSLIADDHLRQQRQIRAEFGEDPAEPRDEERQQEDEHRDSEHASTNG